MSQCQVLLPHAAVCDAIPICMLPGLHSRIGESLLLYMFHHHHVWSLCQPVQWLLLCLSQQVHTAASTPLTWRRSGKGPSLRSIVRLPTRYLEPETT